MKKKTQKEKSTGKVGKKKQTPGKLVKRLTRLKDKIINIWTIKPR